jgi:hypothetical protein
VKLSFDMHPQVVHANPAVADDRGRIALQRGPIVYCMEQLDQLEASKDSSIFPYYTARLTETTTARYDPACSRGQLCWSTLVSCFPLCTALHQAASPAGRRGGY